MYYNWSRLVLLHDPPVEGQDGCGIVWYSVVRPGCEVQLSHLQSMFSAACQLWDGEYTTCLPTGILQYHHLY